jgi:hypothetical protein
LSKKDLTIAKGWLSSRKEKKEEISAAVEQQGKGVK